LSSLVSNAALHDGHLCHRPSGTSSLGWVVTPVVDLLNQAIQQD